MGDGGGTSGVPALQPPVLGDLLFGRAVSKGAPRLPSHTGVHLGKVPPHAFSLLVGASAASDFTLYIVGCSMIAEEDWPAFYEALADVMFKSRCKSSSVVVKVRKDIHMGPRSSHFS